MAPRRDKDAQSSFPSLLEPTLEHLTAPFHKIPRVTELHGKTGLQTGLLAARTSAPLGAGPHIRILTWQHHEKGCPTRRAFRRVGTTDLDSLGHSSRKTLTILW